MAKAKKTADDDLAREAKACVLLLIDAEATTVSETAKEAMKKARSLIRRLMPKEAKASV